MEGRYFHEPLFVVSSLRDEGFTDEEIEYALDELLALRHRREWLPGGEPEWWWILPTAGACLPKCRAKVGPEARARLEDVSLISHSVEEDLA
jgi:hypothetical protein